MEKENKKLKITANKKIVVFSLIALALLIIGSTSYAYFTAVIEGNDTAKQTSVTTGTMSVKLINTEEINLSGMMPGDSKEVHFSVRNTGSAIATYGVGLLVSENNFGDKTDLVYTITSDNAGGSKTESQLPNKSTTPSTLIPVVSIPNGKTQNYTMTITFKETNDDQNDNQGKTFAGKVQLVDANRNFLAARVLSDNTVKTNPVWSETGTDKGLYKESGEKTIDGKPTYYFRGAVENNYVQFGSYKTAYTIGIAPDQGHVATFTTSSEAQAACNSNYSDYDYSDASSCISDIRNNLDSEGTPMLWNIVRINEDGTIRLILDKGINNEASYLWAYGNYNDTMNLDDDYSNSYVKTKLEEWYAIHLKNEDKIIATTFCNNRDFTWNNTHEYNIGCEKDYQFNANIGLLTVEESLYAGLHEEPETKVGIVPYLQHSIHASWLLTTIKDNAGRLILNFMGSYPWSDIYGDYFNWSYPLRPVINLRSDVTITSGDGTKDNPYVIE